MAKRTNKSNGHAAPIAKRSEAVDNPLANPAMPQARSLDAFVNMAARMGWGTPSLPEASDYVLNRITFAYWTCITLYCSHWLFRKIIDAPVDDMCRAWPRVASDIEPDDLKAIDRTLARTGTADQIATAMQWARCFGGAGALMVIDGHEKALEDPLDLDQVSPGSYRGLIPFDRWSGIYPGTEISSDLKYPRNFGLPEFYNVHGPDKSLAFRVHHSRILRFCGPQVPQPEFQAMNRWGISVFQLTYEEVRKRDNMSNAILNLMFRASILAKKDDRMYQALSGLGTTAGQQQQWGNMLAEMNHLLSNQSMMILPKDGGLESHQYTFGGISDVYQQFQLDIAAAADPGIPVSILYGRTLTGLSQSNDADLRIYEMKIAQKQKSEMAPQLEQQLYPVLLMSELGEIPKDFTLKWPSVRVLTDEEKADLASKVSTAVTAYFNAGIFSHRMALKEIKENSEITGVGTNVTDDDIARASDEFPQAGDMDMGGAAGGEGEAM